MPAGPPVQSRYGPTLPEILAPRTRGVPAPIRVAVPLVILAIVLIAIGLKVFKGPSGTQVIVHGSPTFNFRYQGPMHKVPPHPGELVRLEARRHDAVRTFLSSFVVRPLSLPPYSGQAAAALPAFATVFERTLARRYPDFQVVAEGRQRVVNEIAYAIFFTAKLGQRHLSGRDVLLPNPQPGAHDGVELEFLSTPAGGAGVPASVAQSGPLSIPFHTFRFGTSGAAARRPSRRPSPRARGPRRGTARSAAAGS